MGIVEQLLANTGLYVGSDTAAGRDLVGSARIVVSPLPGGAGVSLDYEILNPLAPGRCSATASTPSSGAPTTGPRSW